MLPGETNYVVLDGPDKPAPVERPKEGGPVKVPTEDGEAWYATLWRSVEGAAADAHVARPSGSPQGGAESSSADAR